MNVGFMEISNSNTGNLYLKYLINEPGFVSYSRLINVPEFDSCRFNKTSELDSHGFLTEES
jgi:hypothetical protein